MGVLELCLDMGSRIKKNRFGYRSVPLTFESEHPVSINVFKIKDTNQQKEYNRHIEANRNLYMFS